MQKFLIVYCSKTGNTEKVAQALAQAAPERCDCCGAYLEDGGLLCEKCRKDMKYRINRVRTMEAEEHVEESKRS